MSTVDETGGAVEHEPAAREPREYTVLIGVAGQTAWTEVGEVPGVNRAAALEEAEGKWPEELGREDVGVHLVPSRFWNLITPAQQPPPPPKRRWAGV
jgi:hypothetical protein